MSTDQELILKELVSMFSIRVNPCKSVAGFSSVRMGARGSISLFTSEFGKGDKDETNRWVGSDAVADRGPLFATPRKDVYAMPCSALWPAVKGTVRNSGEYAVVFLDNDDMIASFAIGVGQGFRMGSAVLNPKGDTCEMQVQIHQQAFVDDAGSFKKRVDETLAASPASTQPAPAKTGTTDK